MGILAMSLREELFRQRDTVRAIAAKHGATNLRLFGSAIRGDERPDSDIDLLVDLAENRGFRDYLASVEELESLLGRRVEVIIARSLSPHFRPYVEGEARPL
jgi:predicted nucleotidyltransferase